ncbi:MAG TPA: M67 family metallopeptidase [Vicinamibacterales bacterium]|nr:M67 family metallopeptidase [Vicinamibacterales bacterium]
MKIRPAAVDAIVEHARADAPLECCGLLIGSDEVVEESYRAANLRRSEVAFQVDPADHFAAIRKARAAGLAVIGAYHSHPRSVAAPSETDIQESTDASLLHVIVSLAGPEPVLRGYRIDRGHAVEVGLVRKDEPTIHPRRGHRGAPGD